MHEKNNLRSIDAEWGGGEKIVLEECDFPFRKVINNGQTYYVKFEYFMTLGTFFEGRTAVRFGVNDNWWTFYNFHQGELIQESSIPRLKSIDKKGICRYFSSLRSNSEGFQYHHYYHLDSLFIHDSENEENHYCGTEKFNELLAFLSQYDEPTFAEY